jgi:hypothetical protein
VRVVPIDPDAAYDADKEPMGAFAVAEKAKRRLIVELVDLKLPIVGREQDPQFGLAFDLRRAKGIR